MISSIQSVPNFIKNITVELDSLNRKIYQNLELADKYKKDPEILKRDMKTIEIQAGKMALAYGMSIKDTMNMMQIMSRRFKDKDELLYYTNLSMTLSKLDFVEPAKAAETLEAIVLSFGLTAKESANFVNEFSVATHSARVTGTALLDALQRSAPVLKQYNMGTKESIALVSTLSTYLGREGAYIGNAITGMFTRMNSPQNKKNLEEAFGISFFKEGKALEGYQVLIQLAEKYKDLNEESRSILAQQLFGAYRLVPGATALSAMDEFVKLMNDLNKSSSELTLELLRVQLGSYETTIQRVNTSLDILGRTIGEKVMPTFAALLQTFTGLITGVGSANSVLPEMISLLFKMAQGYAFWRISMMLLNSETWNSIAAWAAKTSVINTDTASMAANTAAKVTNNTVGGKSIEILRQTSAASLGATGAVKGLGGAFVTFAGNMGSALTAMAATSLQMLVMWAIAQAVMNYVSEYRSDTAIEDYMARYRGIEDVSHDPLAIQAGQIENSKNKLKALKEEYAAAARESNPLIDKTAEITDKIKKEEAALAKLRNEWSNNKMFIEGTRQAEEFAKKMEETNKKIASGTEKFEKPGKEKSGAAAAEREAEKGIRLALRIRLSDLTQKLKTTEQAYQENLDNITNKEEIFGKSVSTILDRITIYQARRNQLSEEENKILEMKKEFESILLTYEQEAADILREQVNWGELSLAQKAGRLAEMKTENAHMKSIAYAIEQITKLDEQRNKLRKDGNRIEADTLKITSKKPEDLAKEEIARLETLKKIAIFERQAKTSPFAAQIKRNIELEYDKKALVEKQKLVEQYETEITEFKAEIARIQVQIAEARAKGESEADISKYEVTLAALKQSLREKQDVQEKYKLDVLASEDEIAEKRKKTNQEIKAGFADVVDSIVVQGTSLKDVWKKLWNQLASDAIKALLGVENQSTGTLSKLMGMAGGTGMGGMGGFGGKKGGAAGAQGPRMQSGKFSTGGKGKATSHSGSIVGRTPMGRTYYHSGGMVDVKPRYYHSGGTVGSLVQPYLKSDEVNAVLQTGEEVVSRKDRRSNDIMAEQNKYMADALTRVADNANKQYVIQIQAVDAKSVQELFKTHGDSLLQIFRQQEAYNNGIR